MPTLLVWLADGGVKFDGTITLGNVVAAITFLALAAIAWTDLNWRVKNLEMWRKEHIIAADARDQIIQRMDLLLAKVTTLLDFRDQRATGQIHSRRDD